MSANQAFDEQLLQRLPLPLAQLCRRSQNAKTPLEQHLAAYYLWEASLKLLGATAVVEYAALKDRDSEIAEKPKNLARPAVGHWWEFVRRLVPVLADKGDKGFGNVRHLVLGRARDDMPRAAGLFAGLVEALEGKAGARTTVRLTELFDRLVTYRNREIGHGAAGQRPMDFYRRMAGTLSMGFAQILAKLDVTAGRRIIYIGDVRRLANGGWLIERYLLVNETPRRLEPLLLTEKETAFLPRPECVYLEGRRDMRIASPFPTLRSLHPLVHFEPDAGKLFFLNARRGKQQVEYLCYSTGETLLRDIGNDHRELLGQILNQPIDASAVEVFAARSLAEEKADDVPAASPVGRAIGEYELLSRLGQGGMGVVYRAWQPSLGRQVALKCMLRVNDPKGEARFAREIRALGRIEHPNVVKVFTSGADGDQWFYAMELIEGAELSRVCEHLTGSSAADIDAARWQNALTEACAEVRTQETQLSKSKSDSSQKIPVATAATLAAPVPASTPQGIPIAGRDHVRQVVDIVRQVSDAVHALHEAGVVHRDIKPGNIMLTADGSHPVLMDLGLAQLADETDGKLTRTRQFVGTLRYASPEQILAVGNVDRRTDVYSLGVTLWELLTLRPAFGANDNMPTPDLMLKIQSTDLESPRKHNRNIPRDLAAIVMKCVEKDRTRRYATASDLAADLGRFLRGEPVTAQPPSLGYVMGKFIRRHKAPLAVAACVVSLLVVGAVAAFLNIDHERRSTLKANDDLKTQQEKTVAALAASEENRQLAEQRFNEKRQAMDNMLAQFSDKQLSGMPGTQEIRKVLFARGVEMYEDMFRQKNNDPTVQLTLVDRYAELGRLQSEIGTIDQALEPLKKGEKVVRRLVEKDPTSTEYRFRLGVNLYQIGYCCWEHQKSELGIPALRESIQILSKLAESEPKNIDYALQLAEAQTRLAASMTDWTAERERLQVTAYDSLKHLVAEMPKNSRALIALARVTINRGYRANNTGKHQEAETMLEEARQLAQRAIEIDPTDQMAFRNFQISLNGLSLVYRKTNRVAKGIELMTQVVRDLTKLAAANPAVISHQHSLVWANDDMSRLYQQAGQHDKAVSSLQEIVRISDGLAQRIPQNPQHPIDAITASQKIADIYRTNKRETDAIAILNKLINQAEPTMRLHPTSNDLLRQLLFAHRVRGEMSFGVQQHEKAHEAFQGGVDLFTRYRASVKSSEEYMHYHYFICCRGLLSISREMKGSKTAIGLATKLIVPIKLETFTLGDFKETLIGTWITLAGLYEDTGNLDEAVRLRVRAMEESRTILGGDPKSNWNLYYQVIVAHAYMAKLYAKNGNQRSEFEAIRNYLKETQPYMYEKDHSKLLEETVDFTPHNLSRLREVSGSNSWYGSKGFTVPVDFDGVKRPWTLTVTESWQFVEDQFTFVERVQGGKVPKEVVDSFGRLYKIAKEHKVSFQELCVYALGTTKAGEEPKVDTESPIMTTGSKLDADIIVILQELAAAKREIQPGDGGSMGRKRLALKYPRLAEEQIAKSNYFRATHLLAESRSFFDLDSFDRLRDPNDSDAFAYIQYVQGALLGGGGELTKGYSSVMDSLRTEPRNVAFDFTIPSGNREFALGWICLRLQRPTEAVMWYRRADELGHRFARGRLNQVCKEFPQSVLVLPAVVQESIAVELTRSYLAAKRPMEAEKWIRAGRYSVTIETYLQLAESFEKGSDTQPFQHVSGCFKSCSSRAVE